MTLDLADYPAIAEHPNGDGWTIERLVTGTPVTEVFSQRAKHRVELLDEPIEVGLAHIAVESDLTGQAFPGRCLTNAGIRAGDDGGRVVLGRFVSFDAGTTCRHAWWLKADGRHVEVTTGVADGYYVADGFLDPVLAYPKVPSR